MKCEWAILCDTAYMDTNGKVFINGIFDWLKVKPIPGVHPHLAVVVRLVGNPGETGKFLVEACNPGGQVFGKVEGSATLDAPAASHYAVANFPGFPLTATGLYSFRISVNGKMEKAITLVVDAL